jgi:hypothetical protein
MLERAALPLAFPPLAAETERFAEMTAKFGASRFPLHKPQAQRPKKCKIHHTLAKTNSMLLF